MEKFSHSQLNIQIDYYILNTQRLFHKWEVEKLADNCLKSAYHLSYEQEPRLSFSIHWETLMQHLKISSSGLQIDLTHIFKIRMLIISYP